MLSLETCLGLDTVFPGLGLESSRLELGLGRRMEKNTGFCGRAESNRICFHLIVHLDLSWKRRVPLTSQPACKRINKMLPIS